MDTEHQTLQLTVRTREPRARRTGTRPRGVIGPTQQVPGDNCSHSVEAVTDSWPQHCKWRFKASRVSLAYTVPWHRFLSQRWKGTYKEGVCFYTVWMWLFLRQRGDYGDRASPTFLFPGTGKAMALSLGQQHKVKPQCSGNKGQRRGKINVTCLLSHAECRCKNYTYESREGPRGMGTRKDVGEVATISFRGKCHNETYCFL